MTFYERLAKWGTKSIGAARMFKHGLNLSPMYRRTTGRITHVSEDLTDIRVRIKLSWRNANYRGVMFGGSMFSAMDPMAMVALINILGDDFVVWDKTASIRFKRPANQTVYARMYFSEEDLAVIRREVEANGEYVHLMEIPWTSKDEQTTFSVVTKELYVATKAHHKAKRKRQKGEA